jgi:hypothetical protein
VYCRLIVISRAKRVYREEGPVQVVRKGVPFVYDEFIRPHLPKRERTVCFNGIQAETGDVCPVDRFVPWFETPWYNTSDPAYEQPLIEALRSNLVAGDSVVIVGGGWGVTATVAASIVGESGSVVVYEGAADRIADIKGTLECNGVSKRVTVHHAIVGEPVTLTGAPENADHVAPNTLPDCDLLEMDCEGSEVDILPSLDIRPETLIVETHRNEPTVEDHLECLGYDVVDRGVELHDEIFVLTARRR